MELAGTAVGAISLGIQVTQGLVDYYTAYKHRESDVQYTFKKLTNILNVLEILSKQLETRKFRPDERSLLDVVERSIFNCEDAVDELKQETEKITKGPSGGITATVRGAGRRLAYPFRQSTLQKLDEDVDEMSGNLTLALQVLQQHDMGSVQDEIQDTKAVLELVRASQISADIRDWLRAPDASINYNEACKKKHPGTGVWFVQSPAFNTWLSSRNSFLWIHGFAGCGKSVLSSTIIQDTFRHRRSNPLIGIAFFYFTFNDESKQDTSAMLRGLIQQLVGQLKDEYPLVSRLRESYPGATPPDQALLGCLHQLVRMFGDVYIVLDALDESPRYTHREDVLQALDDMRQWSESGLHLLVTSRDEQDIRERLDPPADQTVPMKNDSIDSDIASFVSGHLDTKRFQKWERHREQIEQALTEGAKGVFRWVECQFAALEACPGSKTRLNALLGSLPRTLDKTYERMLSNIEEESAEDAKRILTLLCTAKRPLTVEELIDGIAVELGEDPEFNEDSRLPGEDDIRHICPGFIEVDIEPDSEEITVRIAHYSVQEYLESDRIRQSKVSTFGVRRLEANTEVATICLAYLMYPGLCNAWTDEQSQFHINYPFAVYAARNWAEHYHEGNISDTRLHQLALQLFRSYSDDNSHAFVSWVNIYKWRGYKFSGLGDRVLSPIYLASRLGLDPVLRELASDPTPIPRRYECYGLSLGAAADQGHATTVGLLLDNGADVNYVGFIGTSLHLASQNGHIKVVEALLDRGADIDAHDYRGKSPLYRAAAQGHVETVRLLLDRGANISPVGAYELPLESAASHGHESVVALLLDRGADPNRGRYLLPLEAAENHLKVQQLLLDRGADPLEEMPLERAAHRGNVKLMKYHLKFNASVHEGKFRTPLEAAASEGHEEAVQLLLDHGAQINSGRHSLPLAAALDAGHMDVARLLIERGADVNQGDKMVPLELAAAQGDLEMAQLLIDRGAYVNAGKKMTPLEAAAEHLNGVLNNMLVNRAAVIANGMMEPMEEAAEEHTKLVTLLLDCGAGIEFENGDGKHKKSVKVVGTEDKSATAEDGYIKHRKLVEAVRSGDMRAALEAAASERQIFGILHVK